MRALLYYREMGKNVAVVYSSATFPNLNNHTIEGTGWSDIENQTSFLIKDGRDADLATAYIDTGIITTDFRQASAD